MNDKIQIYTDGAARGNPGPSGWGVAICLGDTCTELGGRAEHSTNNIMELTAPIEAMKFLQKNNLAGEAEIHSDSKYVITGINEWIHNWVKNNWRTAAKKPVLNQELWQELHRLNQALKPKWFYVAGHSGHKWNDRVDLIATSFADDEPVELRNEISE
ncbi:MAG: ribonuclease HI [Candidatus Paceibacterota bacterium]